MERKTIELDELDIKEEPMDVDVDAGNHWLSMRNIHNFSKKFVAVEYPGVVKNVDKMVESLGGITKISEIISSDGRRMELKFRPGDIYSKPVLGDKDATTGLILKVRIRRKKKSNLNQGPKTEDRTVVSASVLGVCEEIFRFDNFADFQYLPVKVENGVAENVHDKIIPDGPVDSFWLEKTDMDFFFPPPSCSRIDTTEGYKYSNLKKDVNVERHIIGRTRSVRSGFTKLLSFYDSETPEKPFKGALNVLKMKMIPEAKLNIMKKLFENRPIWSRNGIIANTNISVDLIKILLPAVAYYFTNGPWRIMWVRYGYDPRKDHLARIYQTLDYRVKNLIPHIKTKRPNISSNKTSHVGRKKPSIVSKTYNLNRSKMKKNQGPVNYIFKPGMLPDSKQMFYQFCDLHVPEIQSMLARLPEPGPKVICNERTGWLPSGFDERCREILNDFITQEMSKRQADECEIIDDDSNEDEDEDNIDDDGEDEDWVEESEASDNEN